MERIIVGPMSTNCYLYSEGRKECVIIDPGGDPDIVTTRIELLNVIPIGIALTHGHFDHTAGLTEIIEHYQKQDIHIQIAIHEKDRHYLGATAIEANKADLMVLGLNILSSINITGFQTPDPTILLKEDDRLFDTNLEIIHTPGHTEGGICLYNNVEKILFSGDTLFFEGIGRVDLPGGDESTLMKSIRTKLLQLPAETRVFPGHGPITSIEREEKGNPFLR